MPIYEYRCEQGHHFEAIQRMDEDSLTSCQVCEAPVQRVLFAPAVHFKGSGFYNTDYGTARRKRELDRSASEGADKHDSKSADKGSDGASKDTAPAKAESGGEAKSKSGGEAKSKSGGD